MTEPENSIMPELKVRNLKNKELHAIGLSDEVFGAPLREHLVHHRVGREHRGVYMMAAPNKPMELTNSSFALRD